MPKPKIDYDAVPATYTPMMSFNRGYWEEALHKVGCDTPAPPGATVSTRALRESFMECACFWPTNPEPPGCDGRLDVEAHRKFCYFAQRAENQAAEPPKGYIPIAYEDKPEEWLIREANEGEARRHQAAAYRAFSAQMEAAGASGQEGIPWELVQEYGRIASGEQKTTDGTRPVRKGCVVCGKTDKLMKCGKCKVARYCGVTHQRGDWSVHKKVCKQLGGRE
eukprot:TRINITY_DN493_c2_g1_i1.p2 TRINITY_DN493_c2_g1~~TRINITY_DN493_c2_g1_i1.p2  ORF type:complete len:222 (-),score=31.16 TRINITY_DN493_c2_g1_i1:48-713(-)